MKLKDLRRLLRGLPSEGHIVIAQVTPSIDLARGRYEIGECWVDADGVINLSTGGKSGDVNLHAQRIQGIPVVENRPQSRENGLPCSQTVPGIHLEGG